MAVCCHNLYNRVVAGDGGNFRLPKSARVTSRKSIERLFSRQGVSTAVQHPLLCKWYYDDSNIADKVVFSVPKKKIPHAVDRNLIRRRMREAWRLNRRSLDNHANTRGLCCMFIFLNSQPITFAETEQVVIRLIKKIKKDAGTRRDIAAENPAEGV